MKKFYTALLITLCLFLFPAGRIESRASSFSEVSVQEVQAPDADSSSSENLLGIVLFLGFLSFGGTGVGILAALLWYRIRKNRRKD